jgi:ribosomal protein S27E
MKKIIYDKDLKKLECPYCGEYEKMFYITETMTEIVYNDQYHSVEPNEFCDYHTNDYYKVICFNCKNEVDVYSCILSGETITIKENK